MLLSIFFYVIALILALSILRLYTPFYVLPFSMVFLSLIGHAIGTYFYSHMDSTDSLGRYFPDATSHFHGAGTDFVLNIVWFVRYFVTGDSPLETFYFFSAFSFVGGVLWYILYLKFIEKLSIYNRSLGWPAILLMCWPSAIIFTNAMGKDSLCYFFIPLVFLVFLNILELKNNLLSFGLLVLSLIMLTMIRPYLLLIFCISYYGYLFPGWGKINFKYFLMGIILIIGAIFLASWVFKSQGGLNAVSFNTIAERAAINQIDQATGTHFYMPGSNPFVRLLLLPYSFFMNLCFPLFYLARNALGFLASFENLLLVYLLLFAFRKKKNIDKLFNEIKQLKFLFYYFITGMFFLAAINTNLGLAVREKCMYVPAFLVLYCILYAYKKQKKYHIQKR